MKYWRYAQLNKSKSNSDFINVKVYVTFASFATLTKIDLNKQR